MDIIHGNGDHLVDRINARDTRIKDIGKEKSTTTRVSILNLSSFCSEEKKALKKKLEGLELRLRAGVPPRGDQSMSGLGGGGLDSRLVANPAWILPGLGSMLWGCLLALLALAPLVFPLFFWLVFLLGLCS